MILASRCRFPLLGRASWSLKFHPVSLATRRTIKNVKWRGGSVYVLGPNIPNDTPETNELLNLPRDGRMTRHSLLDRNKCLRAFIKSADELDCFIDEMEEKYIEDQNACISFDELMLPMEMYLSRLNFCWSTIRTLHQVCNGTYNFPIINQMNLRANACLTRRINSGAIFHFVKKINEGRDKLTDHQKNVVDKYLLEGHLNGLNLPATERGELQSWRTKLGEKRYLYGKNVDEATRRFKHSIQDSSVLKVFVDEVISSGTGDQNSVTLQTNVYPTFMECCPDRTLRRNVWTEYNSRASIRKDNSLSNSTLIEEIRDARRNEARVLGYNNYVEMSMKTKMAGSIETVKTMINSLHNGNKMTFQKELRELTEFAAKNGKFKGEQLELWDLPYYQRMFLRREYNIQEDVIRQYLTLDSVLSGIFQLVERLFDIKIEENRSDNKDLWHKDVRLFRISSTSGYKGSFLFDPYVRPGDKKTSGWVDSPVSRCDSLQLHPLTCLSMSLARPLIKDQPTLISFSQMIDLFKQVGLVLQQTLPDVEYLETSGINNIEWDAVNICPEMLGLWPIHSYDIIKTCSKHVKTGDPLPIDLFQKIRECHYKFASFKLNENLYKMSLDLALYSNEEFWKDIVEELWKIYMNSFTLDKNDFHPCSFKEIFSGEFPAAYFSFTWAETLAADIFGSFKYDDVWNDDEVKRVGIRFRDTFLSLGGSCSGTEVFRRFQGRDPSPDSLLDIAVTEAEEISTKLTEKL